MKEFLERLDGRVAELAADEADGAGPAPSEGSSRAPARRRRPALLGGIAAIGGLAATFALTGTSAADLPILGTPTTDATSIRDRAPGVAADVDFRAAHAFGTPAGPGYVLTNEQGSALCIVAPDSSTPGEYGATCHGPIADVERDGLVLQMAGDLVHDPHAINRVSVVLPEGAEQVHLDRDGRVSSPDPDAGVVAFDVARAASLGWTVDGRQTTRRFEGPFPVSRTSRWRCPDGSWGTAPLPSEASAATDRRAAMRAARTKACAK